jgi:hypothetical protein
MKSRMILILGLLTCNGPLQLADSASVEYECEQPIIDGMYMISFDTLETKCGSLRDTYLNVVYGIPTPNINAGCHLVHVQNKTRSCEVGAIFDCDDGLWDMKMDWSTKAVPTDNNRIAGVLFVEMERFTGWTCEGTYGFEGALQDESG